MRLLGAPGCTIFARMSLLVCPNNWFQTFAGERQYPKAVLTRILWLLGPKTILLQGFGVVLSLRDRVHKASTGSKEVYTEAEQQLRAVCCDIDEVVNDVA